MTRTLATIAGIATLVAVVCLAAAAAISGPDFMRTTGWSWSSNSHGVRWSHDARFGVGGGSDTTRDFAWTGAHELDVDAPADVRYVDGGPAKITVSGPAGLVNQLKVDGGRIELNGVHFGDQERLTITVTAPAVNSFRLGGAARLDAEAYKQDSLALGLSGASEATVRGQTPKLTLDGSGAAKAHLGDLATQDAVVELSGASMAKLSPAHSAKVDVSGASDAELTTHPAQLNTSTSGAGHVSIGDDNGGNGDDD